VIKLANLPNKFSLDGKVALITGAAGLLGMQHSIALLETGATVVMTDINDSALKLAKQELVEHFEEKKILTLRLDVANKASVDSVASQLQAISKMPHVLINNAAIDPKVSSKEGIQESSRLEHFPIEQWQLQLDVGITGAFLCAQVFGQAMSKSGDGGVILNISSDLSVFSPDQRLYRIPGIEEDNQPVKPVTYSVIKTALIGLTRYLATYWANQGVRCNALSPGGVENGQNREFTSKLSALIPVGRMAKKDEYRSAVQFLCTDASSYLNGQNIVMDGGRSAW
jgi:NAD(P)-dependent dehydrogenase (short-subunit alcohol dehydrogenase family)